MSGSYCKAQPLTCEGCRTTRSFSPEGLPGSRTCRTSIPLVSGHKTAYQNPRRSRCSESVWPASGSAGASARINPSSDRAHVGRCWRRSKTGPLGSPESAWRPKSRRHNTRVGQNSTDQGSVLLCPQHFIRWARDCWCSYRPSPQLRPASIIIGEPISSTHASRLDVVKTIHGGLTDSWARSTSRLSAFKCGLTGSASLSQSYCCYYLSVFSHPSDQPIAGRRGARFRTAIFADQLFPPSMLEE